ncbi:MAG: hypothetical protein A2293_01990 [Elusimicrobia bacterium RIFOXYB2_FULL_49_7]|nr:MAG: hypothetical protein A2293_01990 [Elusimicrobia bacterium RIFOXYB2_FULL_49_7]
MFRISLIFLGGGLGALARFGLAGWVARLFPSTFPLGTLSVNIFGSFLIGLLITGLEGRLSCSSPFYGFLVIGILGGFTTFSAFSLESVNLMRNGAWGSAGSYVTLSLLCCLIGTMVGMRLGKWW